ncbi:MAG: shikimate dehydrogenase [Pseudomonadota bacterium]
MADKLKAFVCGHPIKHSKSPAIHNYWLNQYGLNGSYERIDITPENLATFLGELKSNGFAGGNATIPHKEAVFNYVTRKEAAAEAIGAANTLWFEGDSLVAGNTDAYGFAANLDDQIPQWRDANRAMVFGAGGASRAIIYALLEAGVEHVDLVNRTLKRAETLAEDFGPKVHAMNWETAAKAISHADLFVNSTSLGMEGQPEFPAILNQARDDALAADIVYIPLETPFLRLAKKQGLKTSDGLGMLLHQAVPGFEKWFGIRPVVDDGLRQHVLAKINEDSAP